MKTTTRVVSVRVSRETYIELMKRAKDHFDYIDTIMAKAGLPPEADRSVSNFLRGWLIGIADKKVHYD